MNRRIDQILAGFAEGDAISNEAVALQDLFRAWDVESDIFVDAGHVSSKVRSRCRPLEDYAGRSGDVVIHHYSIASPAVDRFAGSPARRVMIYHNITPSHFYRGFDDRIAAQLDRGRDGLRALLPRTDAIWADSEFNAAELREMGARDVHVFPLLFSAPHFDLPPDPKVLAKFAVPMRNVLYVGRVAPNKHIEDLILAFAWYHRTLNRQSRLVIVGSERSCWRYFIMLRMLAAELDLSTVYFEHYATPAGLNAYYQVASLFVTASEHEGYCLPLIEAMHKGVPIVARRRGGMPEALGGAGVMFDDASPAELGALMHRVMEDAGLRGEILASQAQRMAALQQRNPDQELRALLGSL